MADEKMESAQAQEKNDQVLAGAPIVLEPAADAVEAAEVETEPIAAHYIGGPNYYQGVPRRDLTVSEWNAVDQDLRKTLVDQEIYEITKSGKRRAKKTKGGKK